MGPITISYSEFNELIVGRTDRYFKAAGYLASHSDDELFLTRPLLGELLAQATQMEEFLDSYGARNNCRWTRFRSLTAAIKLFSNVSYELLHIQHSIPAYRLNGVKHEFSGNTEQALRFTQSILLRASGQLIQEAEKLHLPISGAYENNSFFTEILPVGRLAHDLAMRKVKRVSKTVTMLATAFLNLSAESRKYLPRKKIRCKESLNKLSNSISEENVRSLELRFHNLQSLYDTFVSTTQAEVFDNDLPVLRGHISVVLHLLRTARDFAHYYERHASKTAIKTTIPAGQGKEAPASVDLTKMSKRLVDSDCLLDTLVNYCCYYVDHFLTCAENLCRNMLQRYTESGTVEVHVPPYRGFHVRPSTLISKLVLHYGSDVKMNLSDELYDAKFPLELFRANEKINAHKRRSLAQEIIKLDLLSKYSECKCIMTVIHNAIVALAEVGKVVVYEQPLQIEDIEHQPDTKLVEYVSDEIAKLLVTGQIDITTNIKAVFTGDKRVLEDIELLADNGYGEDLFGNNIQLPEKLTYLRH